MPAEQILIQGCSINISKYWEIENIPQELVDKQEAISSLRCALEKSITLQTRSDVPIGVFLSGGVDSSAIALLMKKIRPNDNLYTFTVDYADKGSDDSKYANLIAKKINSHHQTIIVTKQDQFNALSDLMPYMDEPVSDSAIVSTYIVSKKAKELGVKVLLSGAGGDEIFGGYSRYFKGKIGDAEWIASLPIILKAIILAPLAIFHKTLFWRLSNLQNNYIYSISGVNVSLLKKIIKPKKYDDLLKSFAKLFKISSFESAYSRMKLDLRDYLPNNILSITDKATMACSIEGRVPLLDHELTELAFSLPEKINILEGKEKGLFKEVIKEIVPSEILSREKDGFGAPVFSWIEGWKNEIEVELSENITDELSSMIDILEVKKWLNNNRLRSQSAETLYALYILNYWIRSNNS
jgi:asparagine synthase (glutamine-hydrolysing)